MKKSKILGILVITMVTLSGCAAGSATAAYSVRSGFADGLSAEAEQRIVDRAADKAKRDVKSDLPRI